MENKFLVGLLLFVNTPCFAEIRIDWTFFDKAREEVAQGTSSREKKINHALLTANKKDIESRITSAALKYTEGDYADLGPHNFLTESKINIIFHEGKSVYFARRYETPTIILNIGLLAEENALELITIHEFSHAYDDVRGYPMEKKFLETHYPEEEFFLLKQLEARAMKKENIFVEKQKGTIPEEIHKRLMECYAMKDTWAAYYLRGAVLRDWLERE